MSEAVGVEGMSCVVKGTSNPRVMRIIIAVRHDDPLIDTIESWVDTDDNPLPVSAKIEPVRKQLLLTEQS